MRSSVFRCGVTLIALVVCGSAWASEPTQVIPRAGGHEETGMQERRAEWMDQTHRVAPGTDWRQIEDANRLETRFLRTNLPLAATSTQWIERGASNVTGRTLCAALGADQYLYVGSANGGLFRGSESGSGVWTPLTDGLGYGVEQVVTLGGSPPRLFVASSNRLLVSPDGGVTWNVPTGLPAVVSGVLRVLREADNTNTVYALVAGWTWTGSTWVQNWQLLRSLDSGESFTTVITVPLSTQPDIWISRTSAGPLYLLANNLLMRSLDHGSSFTTVGVLPVAGSKAWLAGSEAGAPTFYAVSFVNGTSILFASLNGGASWVQRSTLSDFGGRIHASITDPNLMYIGGVECFRSQNAGQTLVKLNNWFDYYGNPSSKLHADIMGFTGFMRRFPGSDLSIEYTYIHTDGGTYWIAAPSTTPTNVTQSGYRNAQYYGTLTSLADPLVIMAGSQDQGYQVSLPSGAGGSPLLPFTQVLSGDYAHLVSSWPDRSQMVFSVYPGFVLVQPGPPGGSELEQATFPLGAPGFRFLPATAADPSDVNACYVGARKIWRVRRDAPNTFSWTTRAFDFDHGDGDVVGAMATAPGNPSRWYVATYNGRLYYSTDAGATFTQSASSGPQSHYFAGSSIVVSPTNPLVAWVCGSGYNGPAVYRTIDGGVTWSSMGAGLPQTYAYQIALDDASSQTPYLATQAGPYRWNGSAWQSLLLTSCCAPLTDYWSVESVPALGVMRFGTYGRGIWDFVRTEFVAVPPRSAASEVTVSAAPNPARTGSVFTVSLAKEGEARLELFDVSGRRVRQLVQGTLPAGVHRVAFDGLEESGARLRAGLYVVRLQTEAGVALTRLTVTH